MVEVFLGCAIIYITAMYILHAIGVVVVVVMADVNEPTELRDARALVRTWPVSPFILPAIFVVRLWKIAR